MLQLAQNTSLVNNIDMSHDIWDIGCEGYVIKPALDQLKQYILY